ncbi:MAG: DUF2029 domain-containing protein [Kiritimatiellae bacterium]|nr:DUF2029 domain-containing protein [Kiritimatiellia bacterium]
MLDMNPTVAAIVRKIRFSLPVLTVGLFWLVVAVANVTESLPKRMPGSLVFNDERFGTDFSGLYAAGLACVHGHWDELYDKNASPGNQMSPHFASELRRDMQTRGGEYKSAWLYPPPAALLFAPFALLDYPTALRVWTGLNGLALLILLWLVKTELHDFGLSGFWIGLLIVLLGINMPVAFNFHQQNIAVFFAIAIFAAFRGLKRGSSGTIALAIVFLGATKGFSVVWIPFLLLWKSWRVLLNCSIITAAWLVLTAIAGCGLENYWTFLTSIIPATRSIHSFPTPVNESIPYAFSVLFPTLTPWSMPLFSVLLLLLLAFLLFGNREIHRRMNKTEILADADCLCLADAIIVFQMLSSLSWTFYRVHLIAITPLFVHLCFRFRSRFFSALLLLSFVLLWLSPAKTGCIFSGTVGYATVLGLGFFAVFRLWRSRLTPRPFSL